LLLRKSTLSVATGHGWFESRYKIGIHGDPLAHATIDFSGISLGSVFRNPHHSVATKASVIDSCRSATEDQYLPTSPTRHCEYLGQGKVSIRSKDSKVQRGANPVRDKEQSRYKRGSHFFSVERNDTKGLRKDGGVRMISSRLVRHPAPYPTESLPGYVLRISELNGYPLS